MELLRTPTFYLYLGLMFVFCHYLNCPVVLLQQELDIPVNAWGYAVSVFFNGMFTLIFAIGAMMMFSDLPLLRANALFEATRCSRNVWVGGRLLYILAVSVVYTLAMVAFCLLTPRAQLTDWTRWGKVLNTVAHGLSVGDFGLPCTLSLPVVQDFAPWQALGVTALMSVQAAAFVSLVIFCISLLAGKTAALSVASLLSVFDYLINEKLPFWCYRLSPLSFTRISVLYHPHSSAYPTIAEAAVSLLCVIAALILAIFLLVHRHKNFFNRVLQDQY